MDTLAFSPSFFLFARPSFIGGFGQLLDFANTRFEYNQSLNGKQADFIALAADWLAVGGDIQGAIDALLDDLESRPLAGSVA